MADRWLVRVGEKEYGPVDLGTLGDWKREGRLLPTNEVRRESDSVWTMANTIPELFGPPPLPAAPGHPLMRRRTFGEIVRDSFRVYRSAFLPFFVVTLLIAVPTLMLELTSPVYGIFPQPEGTSGLTRARVIALLAFIALVVDWPVFLAGIQIATVDVLEGRKVRVGELLRRAANFFPRVARLSLIVYGSYFICTAIPVAIILSLVSESPTILSLVLALLILAIMTIMIARLWVNFLFWQQSAYISNLEGVDALRESKLLARSQRRPRRSTRPLWRGALLASLWVLIVFGLSAGAEIPLILPKLQSLSTSSPEEIMKMWQNLNAPKVADAMLIGSMAITSLVRALLRPILGIAFVLLYLDARSDFSESELAPPDAAP
jgi:hypothetical protein